MSAHKALAWVLAGVVVAVVGTGVVVVRTGGQTSSATEPDQHCVTAANGLSSRVQLAGCRLPGVSLPSAYFYKANLSRAVLSRADLRQADFTGANASHAVLTGADLSGVVFTGANLSGADLSGTNLVGADFTGANLSGTIFQKTIWNSTTVWPTGYNPPAPIAFFPVPTGS